MEQWGDKLGRQIKNGSQHTCWRLPKNLTLHADLKTSTVFLWFNANIGINLASVNSEFSCEVPQFLMGHR